DTTPSAPAPQTSERTPAPAPEQATDKPLALVDQPAPQPITPARTVDNAAAVSPSAEPASAPRAPAKPVVKASAVAPAMPGKRAWLQIASFKSEQNAQAALKSMSEGNQDLLQYVPVTLRRVEMGADKGTFYVLRIGPMTTVEQATDLCSALKDRKIDCLV